MASVINTNISSLNSQRNLNASQSSLSTSLQRLSSGLPGPIPVYCDVSLRGYKEVLPAGGASCGAP